MTFQQVQCFLTVYKAGSFSEAARKLYVTTPSISIAIHNLETELGYPLFVRTKKGLKLTEAGGTVLEHATHIYEHYRQLSKIKNVGPRSLRIAALEYPCCANAFARLIKEIEPPLNGDIAISGLSEVIIQKLAMFELDVGIIGNYHSRQLPMFELLRAKGLEYRVLKTVPVEIVIGQNHSLYHKETICPEDFEQDVFLDNLVKSISQNDYLKGIMNIPKEKVIAVHKTDVLYSLLDAGVGYTIFLRPAWETCKAHGLRTIPLENVYQDIICVTNPARPLNALGQRFLELIDEEFAAEDAQ